MALISKTIANLVNGVSQQPASIRNPTQAEEQINCLSDVTFGVTHRPHSTFLKKLMTLTGSKEAPYVHTINQTSSDRFKVVVSNGDLKVFDLLGNEKTVSFPNGKAYLTATTPHEDFQCLTLGTKTYVLNKGVEVTETLNGLSESTQPEALIFVKQGDYSTTYSVTLQGTYEVPEGTIVTTVGPTVVTKTTSDTAISDIRTTQIASDLKTALDAIPWLLTYTQGVNNYGSVLHIVGKSNPGPNGYFFQVSVSDSKGDNNLKLIRSQIQKFADLPTVAQTGYIVQVIGDKSSGYDDYYVKFTTDNPTIAAGAGSWAETVRRGDERSPTPSTMPWVLTDNGDGTFTFDEEQWQSRLAGDEGTNPSPSFIGNNIQGMFTFGNRLGFLSKDRVILSEVGVYTNFYLTTVVTFLDSDPIDINPIHSHDKWLYAIPLDSRIILFSNNGQAVMSGDGLLTPKTASLRAATRYPVSPTCHPILVGNNIYFTADNGDSTRVYEYYVQENVDTLKASEITSHVPKYVPVGITKLSGDDSAKMIVAMGCSNTGTENWYDLSVYKYFWIGDQKVQSSWSKWLFPEHQMCVDASIIDNNLYVISLSKVNGNLVFHKVDLDLDQKDFSLSALTKTHLDFRMDGTELTSVTGSGTRTFTLPFKVPPGYGDTLKVYRKEAQNSNPRISWGVNVPIISNNDDLVTGIDKITIEDPQGTILDSVWIGFNYTSIYTFSEIHLKEDQNGVQVPTEAGHLSLRRMSILYNNSLYFRIEVTPTDKPTKVYHVTPYVIGNPTPIEEVSSASGKKSFSIGARNTKVSISVINDSVVPHRLQSAEWEGQYTILSRRI